MESEGETGMVNISEDTKKIVEANDAELSFTLKFHQTVNVKVANRDIKTYLLNFDEVKE